MMGLGSLRRQESRSVGFARSGSAHSERETNENRAIVEQRELAAIVACERTDRARISNGDFFFCVVYLFFGFLFYI